MSRIQSIGSSRVSAAPSRVAATGTLRSTPQVPVARPEEIAADGARVNVPGGQASKIGLPPPTVQYRRATSFTVQSSPGRSGNGLAALYPSPTTSRQTVSPTGLPGQFFEMVPRVSENMAIAQERLLGPASRAFRELSPGDQDKALQVRRSIHPGDNVAALAFDALLAEGRLTSGSRDRQGRSLLEALDVVSRRPGLPPAFMGDMIQEIADPTSIRQEGIGTCGSATAQILLARTNPAEFARISGDLVTRGEVELRDGTVVKTPVGLLPVPSLSPDAHGRSDSSVAFQDAMIQHFAGRSSGMDASSFESLVRATSGNSWKKTEQLIEKMNQELIASPALQALPLGRQIQDLRSKYVALSDQLELARSRVPVSPDEVKGLEEQIAQTIVLGNLMLGKLRQDQMPQLGKSLVDEVVKSLQSSASGVPFQYVWRGASAIGDHWSLLTGVRTTPTGKQEFTFTNPHGNEDTFTRDQLEKVIVGAILPSP